MHVFLQGYLRRRLRLCFYLNTLLQLSNVIVLKPVKDVPSSRILFNSVDII